MFVIIGRVPSYNIGTDMGFFVLMCQSDFMVNFVMECGLFLALVDLSKPYFCCWGKIEQKLLEYSDGRLENQA